MLAVLDFVYSYDGSRAVTAFVDDLTLRTVLLGGENLRLEAYRV